MTVMSGKARREKILHLLSQTTEALSGSYLASYFQVSRQVIVQDIALLRANGTDILSTNLGYLLIKTTEVSRVFKMKHTEEETAEELNMIIDCGGIVKDVFVFHKVYGTIRAKMNLYSREDVQQFQADMANGKSSLLMNVTSGYHYHTVIAVNENVLNRIQEKLSQRGFLARLQDYEPVNFWKKEDIINN